MSEDKKPSGPDLTQGVLPADFNEGKLLGHVADDEVLLVQVGAEVLAINPYCSHYHGLLAEGLVVEDTASWLSPRSIADLASLQRELAMERGS